MKEISELDKKELEKIAEEGYGFFWKGKGEAKQESEIVDDKVIPFYDGNYYIEGDNLVALRQLQHEYKSKIKMIYIDPPYNTGKKFLYEDNFRKKKKDSLSYGDRVHSNWLNMMYPRLKLARDLLTDDGIIFISIDDNEQSNLKKICDEVFGEDNFIAELVNVTGASQNGEGVQIQKNTEICLGYTKNIENLKIKKVDKAEETLRNLNDAPTSLITRMDMGYTIYYNPKTKDIIPMKDYIKEKINTNIETEVYIDVKELIEKEYIPIRPGYKNNILHRWRWRYETFLERKKEIIIQENKNKHSVFFKQKGYNPPKNILNYTVGTNNVKVLFEGAKIFDFPKSVNMLKYLTNIGKTENGLILDFFSGSATTAHAIMQLNAEDGGNRKYIMVQLPELTKEDSEAYKAGYSNICEIGKERIRRAGEKIKNDESLPLENREKLDIGFKTIVL